MKSGSSLRIIVVATLFIVLTIIVIVTMDNNTTKNLIEGLILLICSAVFTAIAVKHHAADKS